MTSDPDDALNWEGDETTPAEKPALPQGWNAVGKGSAKVGRIEADGTLSEPGEPQPMSTAMLVVLGVVGGIYLLYTVGWILGGLTLQGSALFLIPGVMYQVALWAAVLAPALWFAAVWVLTRHAAAWVRILGFLGGVVLLVPWPFVMTGAVGA